MDKQTVKETAATAMASAIGSTAGTITANTVVNGVSNDEPILVEPIESAPIEPLACMYGGPVDDLYYPGDDVIMGDPVFSNEEIVFNDKDVIHVDDIFRDAPADDFDSGYVDFK